MPILSADIKLLKSAVMADTTDGGGAMTGIAVVDGQSNNLYPDTSAMDRAFGRVNFRKVFGVAHSDDTDTLLGGHAIITDAPDDPLVHCALFKTPGWADTRATARELVEPCRRAWNGQGIRPRGPCDMRRQAWGRASAGRRAAQPGGAPPGPVQVSR